MTLIIMGVYTNQRLSGGCKVTTLKPINKYVDWSVG